MTSQTELKKTILISVLLFCGGLFSLFLVAEVSLRLFRNKLIVLHNPLVAQLELQQNRINRGYPDEYNAKTGWAPIANTEKKVFWGGTVTLGEDGLRSNTPGKFEAPRAGSILALGDSFTFGDEVSDNETWPAQLGKNLNLPVVNGGVSGYGLDQMVLRAEELIPKLRPSQILVGIYFDDLNRIAYSELWGLPKPYFDLENGVLVLKNTPVPKRSSTERKLSPLQAVFGYSVVVNSFMSRVFPSIWLSGMGYTNTSAPASVDKDTLSCSLLERLKKTASQYSAQVSLVSFYTSDLGVNEQKPIQKLFACAQAKGMQTIDLLGRYEEVRSRSFEELKSLYEFHHNAKGNHLVAEWIAEAMRNLPNLSS